MNDDLEVWFDSDYIQKEYGYKKSRLHAFAYRERQKGKTDIVKVVGGKVLVNVTKFEKIYDCDGFTEYSFEEIAKKLNISKKMAKEAYKEGMRKLSELLTDRGIDGV